MAGAYDRAHGTDRKKGANINFEPPQMRKKNRVFFGFREEHLRHEDGEKKAGGGKKVDQTI